MKRIPAGLRKVGRPINTVSPQRGCQGLRLDQLSQGPLCAWSITHQQGKCWRSTLRQQVEGQTGGKERCDVLLSRQPSSLQKSCHCMKCWVCLDFLEKRREDTATSLGFCPGEKNFVGFQNVESEMQGLHEMCKILPIAIHAIRN